MKATITLCLLMLIFSTSSAQAGTSIDGIWKIVSIEMAGIYYNFKKDSISLSDEIKPLTDETKEKQIIEMLQMVYSGTAFYFEKNGTLKRKLMDDIIIGSYKIDTSKSVIEMTSKNSLNEDTTEKVKYIFKKGLLSLFMELEVEIVNIVLEKE